MSFPIWTTIGLIVVAQLPWWTPPELLSKRKYEIRTTDDIFKRSFSVTRVADACIISVSVREYSPQLAEKPFEISAPQLRAAPSGYPFGRQAHTGMRPGQLSIAAASSHEFVSAKLYGPRQPRSAPWPVRPDDFTGEKPLMELLARKALAAYATRRLSPQAPVSLGGQTTNAWLAASSGAVLVDLASAAQSLGVSLNWNQSAGRVSFTRSGKPHLVALAADKIKVGSDWIQMPDLAMLKDGKWLVPVDVFRQ
jgi:hypothetical protein